MHTTVLACRGHVRDLPRSAAELLERYRTPEGRSRCPVLGVYNSAGDYAPIYVPAGRPEVLAEMVEEAGRCDEVVLATDGDREGEAIAWHLREALGGGGDGGPSFSCVTFPEITAEAVSAAMASPGDVDADLVEAQKTRRVLDRLAGFTVSPVLRKLVAPGLSAGRVQSVGLAMVVERRRLRFASSEYWGATAQLRAAAGARDAVGAEFTAELSAIRGRRIAGGGDFDPDTGRLLSERAAEGTRHLTEESCDELLAELCGGAECERRRDPP